MNEELFKKPQFNIAQQRKEQLLLEELNNLTSHHRALCQKYDRLISILYPDFCYADRLNKIPYISVNIFKNQRMLSVQDEEVFKVLTSSGTTGQQFSRIYLDRYTAQLQTKALSLIMQQVLGPKRIPMLIIDSKETLRNPGQLSARATGIAGMINFGRNHFFALDSDMQLIRDGLYEFLSKYSNEPFVIFGFTFMIWSYLIKEIEKDNLDLSKGILIHSGGWKKLQHQAITNEEFKRRIQESTGLSTIHNFYGMVEQVGGVFIECSEGYLHPPNYADVIIRHVSTWQEAQIGQPGIIQVLSLVPRSYPGHSILTEDMGIVLNIDECACGRKGKQLQVLGRAPQTELRGCSDTYDAS